jgi:hypothetical protein
MHRVDKTQSLSMSEQLVRTVTTVLKKVQVEW